MRGMRAWFFRLSALFNKQKREREMAEEIESNLLMHIEDNQRQGMTPQEARRVATIKLGGVEQTRDIYRGRMWLPFFETFAQDVRYGARFLVNNRGLTIVATVVLALGIGANSAIFSVVNGVLLKPLPFPNQERLVWVWAKNIQDGALRTTSYPDFADWRDRNHVFAQMAATLQGSYTLTGVGDPQRVQGFVVSADLFPMLGIQPLLGRTFLSEEEQGIGGRGEVVVLSAQLWRRRFSSDPNIIGRSIVLSGKPVTVIGVMPPFTLFFDESFDADLWLPMGNELNGAYGIGGQTLVSSEGGIKFLRNQRDNRPFMVVGRLKSGITRARAQTEMETIAAGLEKQYPESNVNTGVALSSLLEPVVGDSRNPLLIIFAAVGFVLLIACANVANLLLARGLARQREIAIRTALGASRRRIIRQLLTESMLLSFSGCALGLLLAYWGIHLLVRLGNEIPRVADVGLDGRVLGFTLLISLITGLIFGLIPAFQMSRVDLTQAVKEGGNSTGSARGNRISSGLMVIEVALTLVLLMGAGLLIQSFMRLRQVNLGYNPHNVLTFHFDLPDTKYTEEQQDVFQRRLLAKIEAVPGVRSAAATFALPLSGFYLDCPIDLKEGSTLPDDRPKVSFLPVSTNYFRTLGITLIKGREFDLHDDKKSHDVAIISQALARRFYPNVDPIGKEIRPAIMENGKAPSPREIIGIVGDVKKDGVRDMTGPILYLPSAQFNLNTVALVRTDGDPLNVVSAIRRELSQIDKDLPIYSIKPLDQSLTESIAQDRFNTMLLTIFAGVALFLTAIGLYGVMAYSVTQRTHEIGIRMALGAQQSNVLKLVIGKGMKLAVIGIVIGLGGSFIVTRLIGSLLFDVKPTDPLTLILVTLMIGVTVVLASLIPAWRAVKVDPLVALRSL